MYPIISDVLETMVRVRRTLCLKNDTDVAHYNFDTDQPILTIFSR